MPEAAALERSYPQKMFYRINEVSQITGVKPYVLRYWETEFPQLSPGKDSSDQRRYKPKDIDLIFEIKRLLYEEKFTIAGAVKYLQNKPSEPPARVVEVVANAARAPERQLKRLRRMVEELRRDLTSLRSFV